MKTLFHKEEIFYDGSQLKERWIYKNFGIMGDACVSFIGGCEVKSDYMADLEDLREKKTIKARKMLHFISEIFSFPEKSCPLLQRLFVVVIKEGLEMKTGKSFLRKGNDLYLDEKKLNISVAIPSISSSLIHIGLNIDGRGAPVPVITLPELGIEPESFAVETLEKMKVEFEDSLKAIYKVRSER
jgi:hypothetical protein